MDLHRVISDLRAEQEQLDEAILALERLVTNGQKRRGRPPRWVAEVKGEGAERQKRRSRRPASAPQEEPA